MPAGSKTDPPLAKAKPISASVITYLRRRKTLGERELLQPERRVRRCKKLCRHQGSDAVDRADDMAILYTLGFSQSKMPLALERISKTQVILNGKEIGQD
ncbi:zinc finger protein 462-like [Grus japonensis]|uniref:Zinc finger protein 462-like n=1 Tax=Grus japonensis TaxID=30415 RepID=A0ABC9X3U9_GRUJA